MLRDGWGFVPKADTVIEAGDEVLLVLDPGPRGVDHGVLRAERQSAAGVSRTGSRPTAGAASLDGSRPPAQLFLSFCPGWCNRQHACLWSTSLGFESLSRSCV